MNFLIKFSLSFLVLVFSSSVFSQNYPNKPIKLLVPFDKIPFFNNLQTNDLLCIMQYTKTHALAIDEFLFHQDDVPDGLYVLLEGKLKVTVFW